MSDEIKLKRDALTERLNGLLTRAKSTQAAARLYPLYQKIQTERFMTENASEGSPWPALKAEYAAYKLKRYGGAEIKRGKRKGGTWGSWPGGGRKMLIGTSTLAGAVIGPGAPFEGTDHHRAMFLPYSMQISVSTSGNNAEGKPFDYPEYVAEKRPFFEFSASSVSRLKNALQQYLIGS